MRNASGLEGENERQRKKKSIRNKYDISPTKRVTGKFFKVSRCSRAKQRQRYCKKIVLHAYVQSCFCFAI